MLVVSLSLSWLAGVFLGSQITVPATLFFASLIPAPVLFLKRWRKKALAAIACLLLFFGGAFCYYASLPPQDASGLGFYNDRGEVTITGVVSRDPQIGDTSTRIRLSKIEIMTENSRVDVAGDVLLFVPRYPTYAYGDALRVTGELETPPVFYDDTGEIDFDYRAYLAHQGIYSTMIYPDIEVLATGQGFPPMEWIYSLRHRLADVLASVLPEPQASLAQGIILGLRNDIPEDLNRRFSETGTTHILAISGLNIAIVAGLALATGNLLFGRRWYLYVWLALAAVWLYAIISGAEPPVIRSAIMASVFLSAELLGRQRNAVTALIFAAALMTGLDPQLIFSASFQMSFLAVLGLTFIFPLLSGWGRKIIESRLQGHRLPARAAIFASDSIAATLAAILAVWPVVAYYFGIFSLVGPLATLIALPALPGIISLGSLAAAIGLVWLPAAGVIGWFAWLFLSYLLAVVNGFGSLPASHIEIGPSVVLMCIYYPLLVAAVWLISRPSPANEEET